MKKICMTKALVYIEGTFQQLDLLIQNGEIAALGNDISPEDCETVDVRGSMVLPGFLDLHTHGGCGVDVNASTAEDLGTISRFFAGHGVTGWLCSILTDTPKQTLWCIDQAKLAMTAPVDGARLLGIHLEGPFLTAEYKGAMPAHLLRCGDAELFRRYQNAAQGNICLMTVSPEVEGVVEMIGEIAGEVKVAIGHSGADYETAIAAIDAGAVCVTHTFNAMGLFHQHRPGIMGAVLERDVYCEAICDGRHLHPGAVRMLLACKGWDKVIAITDSMQAAGLPDGQYKLGINDVVVKEGDAKLADTGVRAGSTLTADTALRNLLVFTGQPLEKVIPLFTVNPARLLGLSEKKGAIAVGMDADLVVLNKALHIQQTYVSGKRVFVAEE